MSFADLLEDLMAGYAIPDEIYFRGQSNGQYRREQAKAANLTTLESTLTRIIRPLAEDLPRLKYREFLKTDYWRSVRKVMYKCRGRRCSRCDVSYGKIDVHHLSYANHGNELLHLEDLILLCRVCHGKAHDLAICALCEFQKGKGMIQTADGKIRACPACTEFLERKLADYEAVKAAEKEA